MSVCAELVNELGQRGETVAVCESLTAGLAAAMLVDVPGSSAVFRGGLVTYATELKHSLAGVSEEILATFGPVSPECARAMAVGVRDRCGADWGVSLTGVAGPDSQGNHPVGEVWIGIADPHGWSGAIRACPPENHRWILVPGHAKPLPVIDGDRSLIRTTAARFAWSTLLQLLLELSREQIETFDR